MRKIILFILAFGLALVFYLGAIWPANEKVVRAQETENPLAAINQKAKSARSGNVADAESLVTEIIKVTGFESEMPGIITNSMRARVGNAESRYRQGLSSGVPESRIVRTINGLVRRLNLPEYSRTDLFEVRRLRLGLTSNFPQVINQKVQGSQPIPIGGRFSSIMSPAEALFVLAMMFQQKVVNPEFQITHGERVAQWAAKHNHRPGQGGTLGFDLTRSAEVRSALKISSTTMSVTDAAALSEITLNTLGI